jgi:putative ABC transport system permease protein
VKWGSTISLALRALLRNKARSFLTTLGVVIGVGAVIVMISMGEGATRQITSEISSLGSNLLVVVPGGTARGMFGGATVLGAPLFTLADLEALKRECPAVQYAAASVTRTVRAVHGERNWSTSLFGVTPQYFALRSWPTALGTCSPTRTSAKAPRYE